MAAEDEQPTSPRKKNLGAAWADQMRDRYENKANDREKLVDHRVADAQKFIIKEVNKLRGWIKKVGKQNEKGLYEVEYGPLFTAVQADMQALSGTLKTARRLGMVAFEGEHLMQCRDDHVVITLIDDAERTSNEIIVSEKGTHEKTEEKDPFAIDAQTNSIVACSRCKADVMPRDRVGVAGQVLHRKCFECYLPECTVQLTPARYASLSVEGVMRFYCIPHYQQLYAVNADYTKGFHEGRGSNLHVVSDAEQTATAKESHERVKEAIARKQIAEHDLDKMVEEKKLAEEQQKAAEVRDLADKLANAGLAPK